MRTVYRAVAAGVAVSVLALTALIGHSDVDPIDKASMQLLVELEGISLVTYIDDAGFGTCGVGHLLKPGEKCPSTLGEAMKLLAKDTRSESLRKGDGIITHCEPNRSEGGVYLQCRMRRVQAKHGTQVNQRGLASVSSGRYEQIQQGEKSSHKTTGDFTRSKQSACYRSACMEV